MTRRIGRVGEQLDHGEAGELLLVLGEQRTAPLTGECGLALLVGLLPQPGFGNPDADPQRNECGQDTEQEHDAPRIRSHRADE